MIYVIIFSNQKTVVVGLATSDSELYASFPSKVVAFVFLNGLLGYIIAIMQVSALDACGLANYLTRLLRKDSEMLFNL